MTTTMQLDGIEQISLIEAEIAADIDQINYIPLLNNENVGLASVHAMYFSQQGGPDGTAWKENARSTIQAKKHSRILYGKPKNGFRLSKSLTEQTTQSFGDAIREAIQEQPGVAVLAFGTRVEYSIYNSDRPHIGINETYVDGMTERYADYSLATG